MLDLRSFVLAFVVINLTYAALISAFLNTIRIDQPALRLWRWANITSGSAMSLLWLRPWIPLELSLNLAHALTILGIGLELATYALFLGRVKWLSPVLAGTVIGIVVQGLVLLLASSRHPALLALSVIGMTIKAMAALLMFRSRRDSPGVSLAISLTDGAIAAILLGRTVLGLTNFELLAFDPTVINQALYLAAFINYVVNGFGFLLLVQGAANRQIYATSERLREMEREQRELLSVAAHEFRTPAAMIKASTDSLRFLHDQITPDVANRVDNIRAAATRLTDLANVLISRDRLIERVLTPQKERIDLSALVEQSLGAYPAETPVALTILPEPMMMQADPTLLRIAVCNLVDNAIRYHEQADCPIRVSVARQAGQARICVADRGPGIPDDLKQKVFERHFTVRGELAKGIGLSIVRLISRAHDGEALVEDNPGGGSVMVLNLPLPEGRRSDA